MDYYVAHDRLRDSQNMSLSERAAATLGQIVLSITIYCITEHHCVTM
jgi:hypothetical protein